MKFLVCTERKTRRGRISNEIFLRSGNSKFFIQVEEKLIQWFGYAETVIVSDECVTLCMGGPHTRTLCHNVWTVVVCHRVSVSSSVFGWVSVCVWFCTSSFIEA